MRMREFYFSRLRHIRKNSEPEPSREPSREGPDSLKLSLSKQYDGSQNIGTRLKLLAAVPANYFLFGCCPEEPRGFAILLITTSTSLSLLALVWLTESILFCYLVRLPALVGVLP